MNKLQGFYELKKIGIPSIPWKVFTNNGDLNPSLLWTIRVAVEHGDDIDLPRAVGVNADDAKRIGRTYLSQFKHGLVIYYPYFIALKSGIMEIREKSLIIEAVQDDLWNLTTKGCRDVTIIINQRSNEMSFHGDKNFFQKEEINELLRHSARVRKRFKDYIFDQSSILVEWSFAVNTDINRKTIGDKYLVFYECRAIDQ